MATKKPSRIVLVIQGQYSFSGKYFLEIVPDKNVSLTSASGTPVALSNVFGDAAQELRFSLLTAANEHSALKMTRALTPKYLGGPSEGQGCYSVNVFNAVRG
jgi:hypothetical protein